MVRLIGWIAAIHFLLHACAAQLVLPIPGSVDTMESADRVNASTLSPWKAPRDRKLAFLHVHFFRCVGMCVCTSGEHKNAREIQIKRPS